MNNATLCHVVGRNVTLAQLASLQVFFEVFKKIKKILKLPPETQIKTYDEDGFAEAIQNCFENDQVLLFPGVYRLIFLFLTFY